MVENRLISYEIADNAALSASVEFSPILIFFDVKTGSDLSMASQPEVKTERLPYVSLVRGKYWYFQKGDLATRVAGEYGSDDFNWHYNELCRISGVPGIAFVDERKVYFIGWRDGPIKIGLATDVKARREMLQVACPYDLEVLAVTDGGCATEISYHRKFKSQHLRGEWFERCPEIEAEIDRLAPQQHQER